MFSISRLPCKRAEGSKLPPRHGLWYIFYQRGFLRERAVSHLKILAACVAVATVLGAVPALAADAADDTVCLTDTRIYNTRVIDNRTILITDRRHNQYTVHMAGTCIGMDQFTLGLTFRKFMTLSCIRSGDMVSYEIPGAGHVSCFVRNVTAGAPDDEASASDNEDS